MSFYYNIRKEISMSLDRWLMHDSKVPTLFQEASISHLLLHRGGKYKGDPRSNLDFKPLKNRLY